jgi:hypothetical protein
MYEALDSGNRSLSFFLRTLRRQFAGRKLNFFHFLPIREVNG